jgi:DNA replication protein DnaC
MKPMHSEAARHEAEPSAAEDAYLRAALKRAACSNWEDSVPPQYKLFDRGHPGLASFQQQIAQVVEWEPGSQKGLLLRGPTGRAKTRSMWELSRILAHQHGLQMTYHSAVSLFAKFDEQITYGQDNALTYVEAVAKRPLLYIDDLGHEAVITSRKERGMNLFFQLLNRRVELGRPLFITTNLCAEKIAAAGPVNGDPLVRRLLDLCEPVVFETVAETDSRLSKRELARTAAVAAASDRA